jgi:hypothetical protein
MMRTEADLRAVLLDLETHAPDRVAVLPDVPAPRARVGRRALLLAGAAAAAVVAVPVSSRVIGTRDAVPAAPGPRHPWRLTFGAPLHGHRLGRIETTATAQRALMENGAGTLAVTVTVHDPGGYDPTAARAGEPVSVRGLDGFYLNLLDDGRGSRLSGVAWEYARDAWAVTQGGDKSESLALARAVGFDTVTPLRVPFWVEAELPAGLRPTGGDERHPVAAVVPAHGARLDLAGVGVDVGVGALRIEAVPWNGRVRPGPGTAARRFGEFAVVVTADRLPAAELDRILDSVTPSAAFTDRATWFDASDAVRTAG